LRKTTYTIQKLLSITRNKKKKKSFMLSTKRTLSFFLGMHILFFTLPNFFVTIVMIIYYLSLYLFIYHFFFLFSANLFFFSLQICFFVYLCTFLFSFSFSLCAFSCQYYASIHLNILCNFLFLSILFHFYWVFFQTE